MEQAEEQWYNLFGAKVPMPPRDLFIALVTVLCFLPAVVLVNYLLSFVGLGATHKPKKA